jgi:hypothetical protein
VTLEQRILKLKDSQVGWFDGHELRVIAEDVCKMENRIKRLEEAGDNLESRKIPTIEDRKAWRKAKEDKP